MEISDKFLRMSLKLKHLLETIWKEICFSLKESISAAWFQLIRLCRCNTQLPEAAGYQSTRTLFGLLC